jgi:hypothetical protein
MSGADPTEDTVVGQLAGIREALQAQNRALAIMVRDQTLHGEMLAKILEAVTREADGDDPLSELLAALVEADRQHALMLESVSKAVAGDPGDAPPPKPLARYAAEHTAMLALIDERLLDVQGRLPGTPR